MITQGEVYLASICSVTYWTNVTMLPLKLTCGHLKGHFVTMKNGWESFIQLWKGNAYRSPCKVHPTRRNLKANLNIVPICHIIIFSTEIKEGTLCNCQIKIVPDVCDLKWQIVARAFQVLHIRKYVLLNPYYPRRIRHTWHIVKLFFFF